MKVKVSLVLSAILLIALSFAPNNAFAWKPNALCYTNCGLPFGDISANPSNVQVPDYSSTGSTQLRWFYDWEPRRPMFALGCVYVQVNNSTQANVVQCEWPGHNQTTNIPWITAGNHYTFTLSAFVGNSVHESSLITLIPTVGGRFFTHVNGVLGSGNGNGGNGDDGDDGNNPNNPN